MKELKRISASAKTGNEKLTYSGKELEFKLIDFWRWSVSDLLSNATRGRLAEFIVGTAMDINPDSTRDEWSPYDLLTEEGIRIEVKSSAYIQSWKQKKYSPITFSIKQSKYWDPETRMSTEAKRHADVYVFCLLKQKDQASIDPLHLDQWEFYVLPTYELDNYKRSQSSITLISLQKLTPSLLFPELKHSIIEAFNKQKDSL